MKRTLSALLVLIFLNYLAGYYIIFQALRNKADHEMSDRLNLNNYVDKETVTFKFPLTLPYYSNWNSFERTEGSFQAGGEYYKLVKQKLERDTLYIVCIRDNNVKRISGMATDFVKQTNDMTSNSRTLKLAANFSKDYRPNHDTFGLTQSNEPVLKYASHKKSDVCFRYMPVPTPPPKIFTPIV